MKKALCVALAVMMLFTLFDMRVPAQAETLSISDTALDVLKKIEGFSKYPYWDFTQYTVGYGTKCPDDKYDKYKANGITEAEALALLNKALSSYVAEINKFAAKHDLKLTQSQFDALVSFSYNCGTSWLYETGGTLYNAVISGAVGTKFIYAICLWSTAGGEYILIKRRLSDANMYLNGVYEAYNKSEDGTYPENYKYVYMDGNGGSVNYIMHAYDAADASPVLAKVTPPTGIDGSGKSFTYTFAGWYTASTGGTKIEVLDGSLADGAVLYAQWKDPSGNIVSLPKGTPCSVDVTVSTGLNVRTGPATYYPKAQENTLSAGTVVTLTETYKHNGVLWGKCEYGWICLSYTDYDDVISGKNTWPKEGVVNGNNVNVKNKPGLTQTVQYQLSKGAAVTVHEKTYVDDLSWGRLDDGNWICLTYVTFNVSGGSSTSGDINGDGSVNKDDAIYLLRHVVYPGKYPISLSGDINGDGSVNKDDAIYLLRHVVYPSKYPL